MISWPMAWLLLPYPFPALRLMLVDFHLFLRALSSKSCIKVFIFMIIWYHHQSISAGPASGARLIGMAHTWPSHRIQLHVPFKSTGVWDALANYHHVTGRFHARHSGFSSSAPYVAADDLCCKITPLLWQQNESSWWFLSIKLSLHSTKQ